MVRLNPTRHRQLDGIGRLFRKLAFHTNKGEGMNKSMLFIVIGSSVVFIGLIVWKVIWLVKKITSAPVAAEESE